MTRIFKIAIMASLTVIAVRASAQTAAGGPKVEQKAPASPSGAKQETIETRVEKYLRNLYGWGPAFELKIEAIKPSPIPDLLEVPVTVSLSGQMDTAVVYVDKSGNFLIRGDLTNMNVDPFADIRSKIHTENSPSLGPDKAKVTLTEFADFECPSCRQLDLILRAYLPKHLEVRLVFKHFPLTQIHPWAMTAAIASQCAYQQNNAAFWKMHDAIFDSQEEINPSNVSDKMKELAAKEGLNMDTYQACISNPETARQVEQVIGEGRSLNITGTPTTFVNARRIVGADESGLNQLVDYESSVK